MLLPCEKAINETLFQTHDENTEKNKNKDKDKDKNMMVLCFLIHIITNYYKLQR